MIESSLQECVQKLMSSLSDAEHFFLDHSPPDTSVDTKFRLGVLRTQMTEAYEEAFEVVGPMKSLEICFTMLVDFFPIFQKLNPGDRSYARCLRRLKRILSNREDMSKRSIRPPRLEIFSTPGSAHFLSAFIANFYLLVNIMERDGPPPQTTFLPMERHFPLNRIMMCVGSIQDVIEAWVHVRWSEIESSVTDPYPRNIMLYPPIRDIWLEKWQMVADLLERSDR